MLGVIAYHAAPEYETVPQTLTRHLLDSTGRKPFPWQAYGIANRPTQESSHQIFGIKSISHVLKRFFISDSRHSQSPHSSPAG